MEIGKFELTGLCKDLEITGRNAFYYGDFFNKVWLPKVKDELKICAIHVEHIHALSKVIEKTDDQTIKLRATQDISAIATELLSLMLTESNKKTTQDEK